MAVLEMVCQLIKGQKEEMGYVTEKAGKRC